MNLLGILGSSVIIAILGGDTKHLHSEEEEICLWFVVNSVNESVGSLNSASFWDPQNYTIGLTGINS